MHVGRRWVWTVLGWGERGPSGPGYPCRCLSVAYIPHACFARICFSLSFFYLKVYLARLEYFWEVEEGL